MQQHISLSFDSVSAQHDSGSLFYPQRISLLPSVSRVDRRCRFHPFLPKTQVEQLFKGTQLLKPSISVHWAYILEKWIHFFFFLKKKNHLSCVKKNQHNYRRSYTYPEFKDGLIISVGIAMEVRGNLRCFIIYDECLRRRYRFDQFTQTPSGLRFTYGFGHMPHVS